MLARDKDGKGESLCPYDPESTGTILGEGAVAVVLERSSSARSRDAKLYADVRGCGQTADACQHSVLEPEGKWLTQAMEIALSDAGLNPSDLDAVYGHGRGLPGYDAREIRALERLLGDHRVPVSCVIGNIGLAEAGCGAFSAAAAIVGMRNREVYPIATRGSTPCNLAFVRDEVWRGDIRHTLIAGGTEHGNNAALILSRH
jgi:3-oxoacyl-[acyl-carrier-protein] synthase II